MSNIKHNSIRLQDCPVDRRPEELEGELRKITGVKQVKVNLGNRSISIEYDLLKVTQEDIEKRIMDLGLVLDMGLWQRFKRGWIHFTEENERDNLTAKAHSCCEDPTEKLGTDYIMY